VETFFLEIMERSLREVEATVPAPAAVRIRSPTGGYFFSFIGMIARSLSGVEVTVARFGAESK
jgi:hypothetical protein